MSASTCTAPLRQLTLDVDTAFELMMPHVVTLRTTDTIRDAAALLAGKRLSGVPVLDENGEAVGVLSRADLVAYENRRYGGAEPVLEEYANGDWLLCLRPGAVTAAEADRCLVRDVMNPVIFSVATDASAEAVIDTLLTLGVHRLFVTEDDGTVVGVISSTDVLRHLCRAPEEEAPA
jgi:CBS domain-containing protein